MAEEEPPLSECLKQVALFLFEVRAGKPKNLNDFDRHLKLLAASAEYAGLIEMQLKEYGQMQENALASLQTTGRLN